MTTNSASELTGHGSDNSVSSQKRQSELQYDSGHHTEHQLRTADIGSSHLDDSCPQSYIESHLPDHASLTRNSSDLCERGTRISYRGSAFENSRSRNNEVNEVAHPSGLGDDSARMHLQKHSRIPSRSEGRPMIQGFYQTVKNVTAGLLKSSSTERRQEESEVEMLRREVSELRASMEEHNRTRDKECSTLKADNRRLEEEKREIQRHANSLNHMVQMHQDNFENSERKAEYYMSQLTNCEVECRGLIMQRDDLRSRNAILEDESKQRLALLDIRTVELRTAETFLSKYDEIPGDEIVSQVNDLNQLVLGIAEKVSEAFPFGKTPPGQPQEKDESDVLNKLADEIGMPLVNLLRSKDHNDDQTIVQLALQAALTKTVYNFMERWPIPTSQARNFGEIFWRLYDTIHDKEMQAVAARWRVLSSKHLRLGLENDNDEMISGSMQLLETVLQASGAQFSKASQFNEEQLRGDLERLWTLAASVAEKTKESVLSTDCKFIFVPPGSDFDGNIVRSQGPLKKRSPVLCPTELGLMRITNNAKSKGELGKLEKLVMLKATVILEHEIKDLFP